MKYQRPRREDQRNLMLAVALSVALIVGFQTLVEAPRQKALQEWKKAHPVSVEQTASSAPETAGAEATAPKEERLRASSRVNIASDHVQGSIALTGLRFDDLRLLQYRETTQKDSPSVTLLAPAGDTQTHFSTIGWLSPDGKTRVPDATTAWRASSATLSPSAPVTFTWDNGAGVRFAVEVRLSPDYMFYITQRVENQSQAPVALVPYGYVNRAYDDAHHVFTYILHEGPIGVLQNALVEPKYKELREKGAQITEGTGGWLGFTDKYWLAALVPEAASFKATFSHYQSRGLERYQAEYALPSQVIEPGAAEATNVRFFAGAKEITVLDAYAEGAGGAAPIPLFDRAVDFGWFYFLTKPMFLLLTQLYALVGNFGIAIVLLTLVVKLLMYPVANKGFHATSQLKRLQPEMARLKEAHGTDRLRFQQEMIALYKREKVNPAAGCLPVLIQIPVFFALYKVLFVTIEMRHAPFFGWLSDLSAADPSNIFTLFGVIPWTPPSMLHLGILPILMGLTMALQMKQQPTPTDPTQAMMMKIMPWFLTIVVSKMPAGLVFYWVCSNIFSIIQQWIITTRYERKTSKSA